MRYFSELLIWWLDIFVISCGEDRAWQNIIYDVVSGVGMTPNYQGQVLIT